MVNTSNLIVPAGAAISANSPTFLPIKPAPIGDLTDILPILKSASFSETII
jgi:hypothetical protein